MVAASVMALAMGWEDSRSRAAARDSRAVGCSAHPAAMRTSVTIGCPRVSVPVLSKTTLSTPDAASSTSPPRISSPLNKNAL